MIRQVFTCDGFIFREYLVGKCSTRAASVVQKQRAGHQFDGNMHAASKTLAQEMAYGELKLQ